ncbi:hypothetical protein Tco_0854183 [Tanacetum coccineum]
MLAPNGGCLILYQAYGNLYAMTGVFDEVFSTWMAFGGNTNDFGSFGEETNETTDLHQILEEVLLTEHGDSAASIKRCRHDLSGDGVWTLATTSQRSRLKVNLKPSTWQRHQEHQATLLGRQTLALVAAS